MRRTPLYHSGTLDSITIKLPHAVLSSNFYERHARGTPSGKYEISFNKKGDTFSHNVMAKKAHVLSLDRVVDDICKSLKKEKAFRFDTLTVYQQPRYKESELSGDEWRTSKEYTCSNGGKQVFSSHDNGIWPPDSFCDLFHPAFDIGTRENADTSFMDVDLIAAAKSHPKYLENLGRYCDQIGCNDSVVEGDKEIRVLKLKASYNRTGDRKDLYSGEDKRPQVHVFCADHGGRGDCGLEDADDNYETLYSGPVGSQNVDYASLW